MLKYLFCLSFLIPASLMAENRKYVNANHIELMINSQSYDKKNIRVYGYLVRYTSWHFYLYPYKEDDYISDISRAIEIDGRELNLLDCENNYVIVAGTFTRSIQNDRFVITNLDFVKRRDPNNQMDGYVGCSYKKL